MPSAESLESYSFQHSFSLLCVVFLQNTLNVGSVDRADSWGWVFKTVWIGKKKQHPEDFAPFLRGFSGDEEGCVSVMVAFNLFKLLLTASCLGTG